MSGFLREALRGSPCRPFSNDLRGRVDETGLYTYPDVTVVCGPLELADTKPATLLNPQVVVEGISEGTEAHDRGAKAAHYRRRASLDAIVFVATTERRVQSRNADGSWTVHEATDTGTVPILPLGISIPLAEVYAGFELFDEPAG